MDTERAFLDESITLLREQFFPRIRIAVEQLTDEQVWWRPNEASNSIGNLILHLRGNVTQWIVTGVGGVSFTRDRDKEFLERSMIPRKELLSVLEEAVEKAAGVFVNLDPAKFGEPRTIQGNDTTIFHAIYHVVEHFAMHTGQILVLTKMITAKDLELYEFPDGVSKKKW